MNTLATGWYKFWIERRIGFLVLISGILIANVFLFRNLRVYEDITKTLPRSDEFEELRNILKHKGISSDLFFSLTPKDRRNPTELKNVGAEFISDLKYIAGDRIAGLKSGPDEEGEDLYQYFAERVPWYLDDKDYVRLEQMVKDDSVVKKVNLNHQRLFTPSGLISKEFMLSDPLGITFTVIQKFQYFAKESNFVVRDGLFLTQDEKSLFIAGTVNFDGGESDEAAQLADDLAEIKKKWDAKGFDVDYFSQFLLSDANARQIKSDTFLTFGVSLTVILLLLIVYYRSIFTPFFFVLPAGIGLWLATGLITLFRPEVSALSLGAGAIVLGIIVDYSFHFFTHLKHSRSLDETLRDIPTPLLTGCFTTVVAFMALTFTTSPVLQDFGLFAALSLSGAALSVIFVLPVLLPSAVISKHPRVERESSEEKKRPFALRLSLSAGIVAVTILTFIWSFEVKFDDDLMNLNYYPDELKRAEEKFAGINPDQERRFFVVSRAESRTKAEQINLNAYKALDKLRGEHGVTSILSTAILDIPREEKVVRENRWRAFWKPHEVHLGELLDSMEGALGYYENAFDPFKAKMSGNQVSGANDLLFGDESQRLVDSSEGKWTFITIVTTDKEKKPTIISSFDSDQTGAQVFDQSAMASRLVKTVQSDFNFILIVSSGLVFLTLLLIYGRIELALITFLPMALSWIWILGIAAFAGIEFNFVNIVISTFVFGLGDDFAIFTTDGYVSKFARGKDIIRSYQTGIILSAVTTIIGTGVLIFAVHPALNSIALISVIGMVAILFISFTVQPWLLKRMLIGRKKKQLPPVSLINLVFSLYCWLFFLSGCLLLFPIQFILRFIPFGQKRLVYFYHHLMRIFAWMQMYFMVNTRKRVHNRQNLDFSKPSLIIANHQSFIDIVMMISLHPRVIGMTNNWVYHSPFFGAQIRYLGYFPGSDGAEKNLELIRPWVEQGYSVIIFPEGTRSANKIIGRFHKGAFYLAEKLKLDVIPVILHGFNDSMRKRDFLLLNGIMNVAVLPRISKADRSWGDNYSDRCKSISDYFKTEFRAFDLKHSDSSYLQHKILSNYIYKSPLLEWYVKIKWFLERRNFDSYHDLIPYSGRIYDLGCGYGYLSYFLYFRSEERELIGIDYDADKVEIANNCYSKNDRVRFMTGDIRVADIENANAVFLNDVLHYLPYSDHESMLKKCLENLNPGGKLLIRDGLTGMGDRHATTELTEKYSTRIFKFNKTSNELCFISKKFVLDFAEVNNLKCTFVEQSKKTSNFLIILEKLN